MFLTDVVKEMTQKTGQKCTAIRRIYVPSEKLDRLSALQLRGLDPDRRYRVTRIDGRALAEDTPETASGAYWMEHGIDAPLHGDFDAVGYIFDAL